MSRMKLKASLLKGLDLPYNAVENDITSVSRWSVHHSIIFEYDGKFWRASYSEGATEMQDERPWEYEEDVECTEVHQVEKTVKVWEAMS